MGKVDPKFEREASAILERMKAVVPDGWVQVVIVAKAGEHGVRFHTNMNMDDAPATLREVAVELDKLQAGKPFRGWRA